MYAYNLKAGGKSFDEIKQALISRGLDENAASLVAVNTEKKYSITLAKKRKNYFSQGTGWCAAGLTLVLLTHFLHLHQSTYPYFIAACAFAAGCMRLIWAFTTK